MDLSKQCQKGHRKKSGSCLEKKKFSVKKTVKKKIGNYLKQRITGKKLGNMLKVVCKDSPDCVPLGIYDPQIKEYFEGFTNFSLLSKYKRIGLPSKNGVVLELGFTKNKHTAYSVLKCAISEMSDNLYYEYYVGKNFINRYIQKFPCFLETYNVYYMSDTIWDEFYKYATGVGPAPDLRNLTPFDGSWEMSCVQNKKICISVQHFPRKSFSTMIGVFNTDEDFKSNYCGYMYQVYFVLAILGNKYTHYDLHSSNVCLYRPYENGYIEMHYHSNGTVLSFPTKYVAKIIDYGRNYFDNGSVTTTDILEKICSIPDCKPACGTYAGYDTIQGNLKEKRDGQKSDYIFPNRPNISHDLRLVDLFRLYFYRDHIFNKMNYLAEFGTAEHPCSVKHGKNIVHNVFDIKRTLESKYSYWRSKIEIDPALKKMADMHIYDDGRDYEYNLL